MPIKKCDNKFGYDCDVEIEYESKEFLNQYFPLKNTRTGPYNLNTCRTCVNRHRRELGMKGVKSYSYKKDKRGIGSYHDVSDTGTEVKMYI